MHTRAWCQSHPTLNPRTRESPQVTQIPDPESRYNYDRHASDNRLARRHGRDGRSAQAARRRRSTSVQDRREVATAIRTMVIRGAPAIGVAAAMGIALGMQRSTPQGTRQFAAEFQKTCDLMAGDAADRGQPVLGDRADEAGVRRGRAGRATRPTRLPSGSTREAAHDPRRGRRRVPGDRRLGAALVPDGATRAHPLQRRRARDRRLRHGARRHPRARSSRASACACSPTRRGRSCRARGSTAWELSATASTRR